MKMRLVKNKALKEELDLNPDDIQRRFFQKTDKVPKKVNRLIAVIFREDKIAKILMIKSTEKDFVHKSHLYFIDPECIYLTDNGNRIALYLEGVSTPISHNNIEKYIDTVKYTDIDGSEKVAKVVKIKGLKWDSRIIELFTNRKFAEVFTRVEVDKWAFYTFIMLIVMTVLSVVNIVCSVYFK